MRSGSTREFLALCAIAQHFGRPHTPTDQPWIESRNGHLKAEYPHLLAIRECGRRPTRHQQPQPPQAISRGSAPSPSRSSQAPGGAARCRRGRSPGSATRAAGRTCRRGHVLTWTSSISVRSFTALSSALGHAGSRLDVPPHPGSRWSRLRRRVGRAVLARPTPRVSRPRPHHLPLRVTSPRSRSRRLGC